MAWFSLGTVTVGDNWIAFPQPSLSYETFRLKHSTVIDPFNRAYLTRLFPLPGDGGIYSPWRLIYPSDEPVIIEMPMPQKMLEAGIVVCDMIVRRKFPYYPVPWTIELEALT